MIFLFLLNKATDDLYLTTLITQADTELFPAPLASTVFQLGLEQISSDSTHFDNNDNK